MNLRLSPAQHNRNKSLSVLGQGATTLDLNAHNTNRPSKDAPQQGVLFSPTDRISGRGTGLKSVTATVA